jgi:hypothetical protein
MSGNKADELDYYRQQITQTEDLLAGDPKSEELKQLLIHLKATHENIQKRHQDAPTAGRTCEVFFDGKWFNSETISMNVNEKGEEKIIVRLLGSDQGREYPLSEVKFLPLATQQQFPEASRVQAIWKGDGLWYNAKVAGFSGNRNFLIAFDGFEGDPEPVASDRVREPIVFKAKPKPPKEEKTYTTPAGYVIPEKLKIDPTKDTATSIAEKKRKIHHLKSQQRTEKHVDEISTNQSKWQQFQQKVARK